MDQNNELIQALLSDPERLSAAISAVSSVLGTDGGDEKESPKEAQPPAPKRQDRSSDGIALLKALKPFLSKDRQERVDRAVRMLALADLASGFKDIL